ncbi:MAG: hypothetical protein CO093_01560 [Alphaproteobacteria bacterium CG_4_9_14_3_um_filter_47_13]|nr:MAG: hypothetical protein CO093_01560 [Alphaproteobacteria bacterium CG_4_9_14_3_um_filter_47_13]
MKRTTILLIAAVFGLGATLFLLQGQKTAPPSPDTALQENPVDSVQAPAGQDPVKLSINGQIVDPLCFALASAEQEKPSYPVTDCAPDLVRTSKEEDRPMGEQFYGTTYESRSDEAVRGMAGYRYLGDLNGHKAVWIVENSGGSGVFSTLSLLDYEGDGTLSTYEILASGDRCNGGVADAGIVDGTLSYMRDVTPYDILALTGNPERPVLQTENAQQLPACAACCYARAHYENGDFTGIQFDLRLPQGFAGKTYREDNNAEKCFDDLIKVHIEENKGYLDVLAFESFIKEIETVCLGYSEGE